MTELYKKSLSDIFLQFSNIPISELEELVNLFSLQEFKKKSIIIAPNNTSDIKLFFVVKGLIRIYYPIGEREVTIDFKEENTLFANGFIGSTITDCPTEVALASSNLSVVISNSSFTGVFRINPLELPLTILIL